MPIAARAPDFEQMLERSGLGGAAGLSLVGLTAAISREMDRSEQVGATKSDFGEMAQMALVEALNDVITPLLPSLFEPRPEDLRRALARHASGDRFGALARNFFARLTSRTLDYYLSRELANHVGEGKRFPSDAERVAFDRALALHAFEAARLVEAFAGGWYGKQVWQAKGLTDASISSFAGYAFKKIRDELGHRRLAA